VRMVRVDPRTGKLAGAGDRGVILEAFKVGSGPGSDNLAQTLIGGDTEAPEPATQGVVGNVRPVSAGDLY